MRTRTLNFRLSLVIALFATMVAIESVYASCTVGSWYCQDGVKWVCKACGPENCYVMTGEACRDQTPPSDLLPLIATAGSDSAGRRYLATKFSPQLDSPQCDHGGGTAR